MSLVTLGQGHQAWYTPASQPSTVGLIVLQEWWGLNDQIKALAGRFSSSGSIHTIAPDLYHGRIAATPDEATHLMNGLDWGVAIGEIKSAATYLREHGCQRVAVTGFCMGGALSFAAAVHCKDVIDLACPFYGTPPKVDLSQVKMPVQAHFGKLDDHKGFSDEETAKRVEGELKASGERFEFYWYETGHAFMNEARPDKFHPESAKEAFERVLKFIKET